MLKVLSGTLAALLIAGTAFSATVDVVDPSDTDAYFARVSYTGDDGDIQGWFVDDWNDGLAELFGMGSDSSPETETAFVAGVTGTELELFDTHQQGETFSIEAGQIFTAKFGQSLAIFWNTTADAIDIDWISVGGNRCPGDPNECGGLSHVYSTVPVPASFPLMLLGLGGLGFAYRRRLT